MERKMEEVGVSVGKGRIYITQGIFGDDDSSICIHPDQVPLLIRWLQEAADELKE